MVPTQVVKSGGKGAGKKMTCADIYASFTPPIRVGPYKKLKGRKGWQREHYPPCSNFHKKGRGGGKIPGCSGYSTDAAPTYLVFDGQTVGTQHRKLTESARNLSKALEKKGANNSVKQWLDKGEKDIADSINNNKKMKCDPEKDRKALADAAAACIRAAVEKYLEEKAKVDESTKLRNGQAEGKPPAAKRGGRGKARSRSRG